jgi:hypothetical protein
MPWTDLRKLLSVWHHRQDRSRLWRIARRLDTAALTIDEGDDGPLVPDDFLVPESRAGSHFLGFYSPSGIEYALRAYGIWGRMEDAAPSGQLEVQVLDTCERLQRLRVVDAAEGSLVGELRAGFEWRDQRQWLYVDWILSQRPGAAFPPERPALPGQEHPGGGIGRELMEIVLLMGHRLHCDGLIGRPAYFHNAVLYQIHFGFEDPANEALYRAVRAAWMASGLTLGQASWAVLDGRLRDQDDNVVRWNPAIMLAPLVPAAEFETAAWKEEGMRLRRTHDLRILPPEGVEPTP